MSRMAITTEFHGPTNSRGSRVKATGRKRESWGDRTMPEMAHTESWDHASNIDRNHCEAAARCAVKLGWSGLYVAGSLSGGGFAFVNVCSADLAPVIVHQLELNHSREGSDFFLYATRYAVQPERDELADDSTADETRYQACSEEEAQHWSLYDLEADELVDDFPTKAKAEAHRIELETAATLGHWA